MLTPEELRDVAETTVPIWDKICTWINNDIIRRICARLGRNEGLTFTGSDKWQTQVLQEAGGHLEELQKQIKVATKASDEDVRRIFEESGIKSVSYDNKIYEAAGIEVKPLPQSPRLKEILQDAYTRTNGDIHNYTRTTAIHSQRRLVQAMDDAYMKVMSGAASRNIAVTEAIENIAKESPYVMYAGGVKRSVESVVSMCVRTGIGQATGNMSIQRMKENDWDIILVSAHLGARCVGEGPKNHESWQGKFYSRTGNDKRFAPFYETTGYGTIEGLSGVNCRHSFGLGDGKHNPYKEIDTEENRKAYDLSQKQRAMERAIRNTKREIDGIKTGLENIDDPQIHDALQNDYNRLTTKVKDMTKKYEKFSYDNKIKTYYDRIQIAKRIRDEAREERKNGTDTRLLEDKKIDLGDIKGVQFQKTANNSNIRTEDVNEIKNTISDLSKEYNIKLDRFEVGDYTDDEHIYAPMFYRADVEDGRYYSKLVINNACKFWRDGEDKNTILNSGYFSGNTLEEFTEHELAHIITFQRCKTYEDYTLLEKEVRESYTYGLSQYNLDSKDGAESIAEAFVLARNGRYVNANARKLLENYVEIYKK